jgi:hypothetical protein
MGAREITGGLFSGTFLEVLKTEDDPLDLGQMVQSVRARLMDVPQRYVS